MPEPQLADAVELVQIVGAARSGTTLTRVLLDAHPEIGCPGEVGIPNLMVQLSRAWTTTHVDDESRVRDPHAQRDQDAPPTPWQETAADQTAKQVPDPPNDAERLSPAGRQWVTRTCQELMLSYCAPAHKRIYCDKSLDSVFSLKVTETLFPRTKSVLVFRHVMDTIASGIDASPWGFHAYGYVPYVQAWPGNSVAALASYWLDHVTAALSWETDNPQICHRLRYEDLVLDPEQTITGIQTFLGVKPDLTVLSRAFSRPAMGGPGDFKVPFTTNVHTDSLGHGKRIPVGMLPARLLEAVNKKLHDLGYDVLDESWNTTERAIETAEPSSAHTSLEALMSRQFAPLEVNGISSFAVVAEDRKALRWRVEPETGQVTQGDGEVEAVLTGRAEDLVHLIEGSENLGVLMRSGRVRHVVADQLPNTDASREVAAMADFLAL